MLASFSFFFFCPVSTSCASPHMTPMRSCTRCWSWPSVRAARASACSDFSSRWHYGCRAIGGEMSVVSSGAAISCIHLHPAVGRLCKESLRLQIDSLSGRETMMLSEGPEGFPETGTPWCEVQCYCIYIEYLAFVKTLINKKERKKAGTAKN